MKHALLGRHTADDIVGQRKHIMESNQQYSQLLKLGIRQMGIVLPLQA
jgi:hypothetical protein